MSTLVILLPPRERLGARAAGHEAASGLRLPSSWSFVFSTDGRSVSQAGSAPAAQLPRADHTVLLLAEADVSWHRIDIPKAPAARLRAALLGVMEEALLEDDEALHFALAADAAPGRNGWVAVTHKPRLQAALAALESVGLSVERVATASVPGAAPRGHFFTQDGADTATPWLALAQADGVVCLRLQGGLARALQPAPGAAETAGVGWTATPAAATAAERWLGAPVAVLTDSERALEALGPVGATKGVLNLRQFELVARHRGTRALREAWKRFLSTEWRLVRWGLAALVAVQLVGLNLQAWQQRQVLTAKRAEMVALLKTTHPSVRAVLDAPLQMERETERLRAAAGRPGDKDLEALLGAAAGAWPDGLGPAQMLRFEGGRLTVAAAGWAPPQVTQFRERLRGAGYSAEFSEGRITIGRTGTRGAV
jgi:general secretion pathway protein L